MIKFVYFDIGGVVFHFSGGLRRLAQKYQIDYSDFERVFRKYHNGVCVGSISAQDLWNKYQSELKLPEDDFDFASFWVNNLVAISQTHTYIQKLIDKGFHVGLLTNIYRGTFDLALAEAKIPDVPYTTIIQSCEIGYVKPQPEIYLAAERLAGVQGEDILFVDDKEVFLEPARKLGWQAVLFDESNPEKSIEMLLALSRNDPFSVK